MYVEEAVRYLNLVDKANRADLADRQTNAGLYLSFVEFKHHPMNVSLSRSLSGWRNALSNPSQLYEKGWDETLQQQYVRARTDDRK